MHIQGWENKIAVRQQTFLSGPSGKRKSKNGLFEEQAEKKAVSADSDISPRLELLKKVQKRIQGGFYNSDAVVEDLSFGFAQALDQTL